MQEILSNQNNNNNFDEQIQSIGSADTLKRAMTVNKLSDMLDCIKDMKFYAKTIEKDLPDYLDKNNEISSIEFNHDDFLQLAKQRLNDDRYIILNDLIKQNKKSTTPPLQSPIMNNSVEYMKRVIEAQPSALESIYLEALLNPDQWESNHQLLQTSPMDILTTSERKRLNEILNKPYH